MLKISSAQIDPFFSAHDRPDSPGCVLAVILDGQIIYQRGYGMADLERGVALSPKSVFDIASTGKQFTAFIVLALAQQGKLNLDAPVREYLPELHTCCDPVKMHQLLHHTSGIRNYCTLMELVGMPVENYFLEGAIFDLIARQRSLCQ
jgi:CubicO group peptidase (beta-lactamase class C family)